MQGRDNEYPDIPVQNDAGGGPLSLGNEDAAKYIRIARERIHATKSSARVPATPSISRDNNEVVRIRARSVYNIEEESSRGKGMWGASSSRPRL